MRNPHPGEILKNDFIYRVGISQNWLAHAIRVPANRVHEIVRGRRGITADTDLRLCKYFGLAEGYFLQLQNVYDLKKAKQESGKEIAKIKSYRNLMG